MRTRARFFVAGFSALALTSALTACSTPDSGEANTQVCDSVSAVRGELATLRVMLTTGVATVAQVEDQVADVRNSVHGLTLAGEQAAQAAVRDIQAAQATFEKAIRDIPSSASVTEAREGYKTALTAYTEQLQAIGADYGCPAPA
jgi:hypothetical protein